MPVYTFKALDREGRTVTGDIGAQTREAAAVQVRARMLTPLRLQERTAAPRASAGQRRRAGVFVRNLSMLLQAGHTAEQALSAMSGHAGDRAVAAIAANILAELRGGASLSEAMLSQPGVFQPHFAVGAEAGQVSGALGPALAELSEDEERRAKLVADLRGALAYPAVLAIGLIGAMIFMFTYILPKFSGMFDDMGAKAPAGLAQMLAISAFIQTQWPWILSGIVAIAAASAFVLRMPNVRMAVDRAVLKMPVLGPISTAALSARFFRVLGLLLRNGQTAAPALAAARRSVSNSWARARFDLAFDRVKEGQSAAAEVAASDVLPPLAGDLLRVSEDAGVLAQGAERLALLYEADLERRTQLLVRVAEPVMVGLAGVLIGAMMISIVSALISVNETIAQ